MTSPAIQRDRGWISFDVAVPADAPGLPGGEELASNLLALSAFLASGCKYALSEEPGLCVRAEWPEPGGPLSKPRTASLEAGVAAAAHQLGVAVSGAPVVVTPLPHEPAPDLAGLCRDAGWPFDERSDGTLVVDLGVNGAYVAATVAACDSGIAIEAELVSPLPEPGLCRTALAAFLLRANGAFRMARAVFRAGTSDGGAERAVLEAPLPADTTAAELGDALGALAVVAQHCAIEAQLIAADERIARAYCDLNELPGLLGRKSATKQDKQGEE